LYRDTQSPREISEALKSLKIDYICNDIDSLLKDNKDGIRKISDIVKNLKDFARVNPQAERESADLNVIIDNVLLILRMEKNHAACKITDNGCGIPQDIHPRIFEPFFTTKDPGEGTGLGLYIAYDIIVKKHHGEIAVQSDEGKGTAFTLLFKFGH
jgi:C4-dicarboxylate-specific signal transduction histidine kinase